MSISHPKFTTGAIISLAILLFSSLVVSQTTYPTDSTPSQILTIATLE